MDGAGIHRDGEHGSEQQNLDEVDKRSFKQLSVNCLWHIWVKKFSRHLHAELWCLEKTLGRRDRLLEAQEYGWSLKTWI